MILVKKGPRMRLALSPQARKATNHTSRWPSANTSTRRPPLLVDAYAGVAQGPFLDDLAVPRASRHRARELLRRRLDSSAPRARPAPDSAQFASPARAGVIVRRAASTSMACDQGAGLIGVIPAARARVLRQGDEAKALQQPLPDDALRILMRKEDRRRLSRIDQ